MAPFYLLIFVAGLLLAQLLLRLLRLGRPRLRDDPFERREFLDASEFAALEAVAAAAGPQFLVCAKVAASSLIKPEAGLGRERTRLARNLVQGWVLDLVVVTAETAQPLCVIQFDPPERRQRRSHARLIAACSAAGLPVITLSAQARYDEKELRHLLREAVRMTGVAVAPTIARGAPAAVAQPQTQPERTLAETTLAESPLAPEAGIEPRVGPRAAATPVLVAPNAPRAAPVGASRRVLDEPAAAASAPASDPRQGAGQASAATEAMADDELALLAKLSATLRSEDDPPGTTARVAGNRDDRGEQGARAPEGWR